MIKVEIGQRVIIHQPGNRYANKRDGTVVKVGRVWIDVLPDSAGSWTHRFRLDTQTDGTDIGHPAMFYTLDQWAQHERDNGADAYLKAQGITIEYSSPWRGRQVELAALVEAAAPPAVTVDGGA